MTHLLNPKDTVLQDHMRLGHHFTFVSLHVLDYTLIITVCDECKNVYAVERYREKKHKETF